MDDIHALLTTTIDRKASDLHLIPEYFPTIRINSELYPLKTSPVVTAESAEKMIFTLLTEDQKENLLANKEIDFGYEYQGHRFRVNAYYGKAKLACAFRAIPEKIKTIEELHLPPIMHSMGEMNEGLVLITGPTGEGKSTTLASIINEINLKNARHVVTIEDPIEFVYPREKSIISQRELHQDTHSWTIALRSVLREDPDVVLVGEMRDYDTIQAVLTIAETGHLVFSTLHTSTTPDAINRIIDVFPAHQQNQIRSQLSSVLRAVISQRLLPNLDGSDRVPVAEILLNIPSVSSIIREGKVFLLDNVLETEEQRGMILFEKALLKLVQQGAITKETAQKYAIRTNEFKKFFV